jgi:hypothetical protein
VTEVKRGGTGRGQGRKPLKEGQETVTLSIRLTVAQRAKLERLGGAAWLRDRIDKAKAAPDWQTPVVHDHDEEPT